MAEVSACQDITRKNTYIWGLRPAIVEGEASYSDGVCVRLGNAAQ